MSSLKTAESVVPDRKSVFPARLAAALAVLGIGSVVSALTVWIRLACTPLLGAGSCPPSGTRIWAGDWVTVWAAGRLARHDAALAYQPVWLNVVSHAATHAHGNGVWGYPPTYLMLIAPLAKLSPMASDMVFQAVAFLLALLAARTVGLRGLALAAAAVCPAAVMSFCIGQNGALTAALLVPGLLLASVSPLAAGGLLGMAAFKPQLVLLVPVCLAASRNSKAALAACLAAVASAVAATLIFGTKAWYALFTLAPPSMLRIVGDLHREKSGVVVISPLESLAAAGMSVTAAAAVQAAVTLACAVVAWRAWSRRDADPVSRLGLTLALGLLATGYGYVYDTVALSVAIALASARGPKFTPPQALALSMAWSWPVMSAPLQLLVGLPPVGPLVIAAAAWAFHARLGGTTRKA